VKNDSSQIVRNSNRNILNSTEKEEGEFTVGISEGFEARG